MHDIEDIFVKCQVLCVYFASFTLLRYSGTYYHQTTFFALQMQRGPLESESLGPPAELAIYALAVTYLTSFSVTAATWTVLR